MLFSMGVAMDPYVRFVQSQFVKKKKEKRKISMS
jgi:hypothetical protein